MALILAIGWREQVELILAGIVFSLGAGIVAIIAYLAWTGWPRNFDRWMWWTMVVLFGIPGTLLAVFAQRMEPISAWQNLGRHLLFTIGITLLFFAFGCGLAVVTCRRGPPQSN